MSFARLLHPRSIAVFGGAAAAELIRQCDRMGYNGEIWPVHPRKERVLGRQVFRSVADLPGSPDAAYVAVNRHLAIDVVRELAARGAGGAVCYATGFTEAGAEGAELENELRRACGDMPLIGPNSYGLVNYIEGAMLWPDQQGGRRIERGVALIAMSSNVAFNLTMQRRGLPLAYVVSLGNKLKFDVHDAIRAFAQEEQVTAIGLYLEAISDPRAFATAVREAAALDKPIVAIKTGRSEIAREIVVSHTASLAGSDRLIDGLFERIGVARVESLEALVEALKVLHVFGALPGGRVGAMSTSGGDLSLIGDAMQGTRLSMPPLSVATVERLRGIVHERMVVANPLDFQMFDWNNEERLARTFTAFIAEGFDLSVCVLDHPRADKCDPSSWEAAERGFVRAANQTGARCAVLSTFSDTLPEPLAERLIDEGIVPLAGVDSGLAGIEAAVDIGEALDREALPPLLETGRTEPHAEYRLLDEAESKHVLREAGIPVPVGRVVKTASEAVAAAAEIGYPVVVKALGVSHKSDVGGVRLDLDSEGELSAAIADLSQLSDSFLVEDMVEGVVAELLVGVARDAQFGPYLLVGAGGLWVELMRDSVPILLPTNRATVLRSLQGLECAPLFDGFRGRPPVDLNGAVDVVLAIAKMVEVDPQGIAELDINPLLLLAEGQGVVAADALIKISTTRTAFSRVEEERNR